MYFFTRLWISGVVSSGLSGTIQRRREYQAALLLSLAFSLSDFVVATFVVVSAFVVVAVAFRRYRRRRRRRCRGHRHPK